MYEVGYSDVKAFRAVFRKITGMSPLEYRSNTIKKRKFEVTTKAYMLISDAKPSTFILDGMNGRTTQEEVGLLCLGQ